MENELKKTSLILMFSYLSIITAIYVLIGQYGFFGDIWAENTAWKMVFYGIIITHVTITSMSLSFHRYHTHKGVVFNPILDTLMQLNLWLVGGMSKLDWVSVHIYHHAHSDKEKDPHSPVQKGLLHILFLGVFDYGAAKSNEDVLRIRNTIKRNKIEQFIADRTLMGLVILTVFNLFMFGPLYGSIISLINFLVSPIFAVGGVNGFAHWFGYKNHNYHDNSRNLGFVFPLNFLICGELDHNNHHAHPTSCSFRHRWFEFDWGYFYINILSKLGLAQIKHAYTPKSLKRELSVKVVNLMEMDARFKMRLEELAAELNTTYNELLQNIKAYIEGNKEFIEGKKIQLSEDVKVLISEAKRTFYMNYRLNLNYN